MSVSAYTCIDKAPASAPLDPVSTEPVIVKCAAMVPVSSIVIEPVAVVPTMALLTWKIALFESAPIDRAPSANDCDLMVSGAAVNDEKLAPMAAVAIDASATSVMMSLREVDIDPPSFGHGRPRSRPIAYWLTIGELSRYAVRWRYRFTKEQLRIVDSEELRHARFGRSIA